MRLAVPITVVPHQHDRTPVTTTLMVAIGVAALTQWVLSARMNENAANWAAQLGYVPAHPTMWAIVTAPLVHANALHLFANLLGLWLFARYVERAWGSLPFAIGGVGAQWLALTVQGQVIHRWMPEALDAPLVGASAWVAFAMGAAGVCCPNAAVQVGCQFRLSLRCLSLAWLIGQGMMGVGQWLGVSRADAAWAHTTAWAAGWAVAWALGWQQAQQQRLRARALAAAQRGAWDEAARWWHAAALATKGSNAAAWLAAAHAWLQAGQPHAAERAVRHAVAAGDWGDTACRQVWAVLHHPHVAALSPSVLLTLAEHLERVRCWDEALHLFESLGGREDFDRAPYALLRAVALYWRMGRIDRAQHALLRFWMHPAHALWRPLADQLAAQYRAERSAIDRLRVK